MLAVLTNWELTACVRGERCEEKPREQGADLRLGPGPIPSEDQLSEDHSVLSDTSVCDALPRQPWCCGLDKPTTNPDQAPASEGRSPGGGALENRVSVGQTPRKHLPARQEGLWTGKQILSPSARTLTRTSSPPELRNTSPFLPVSLPTFQAGDGTLGLTHAR